MLSFINKHEWEWESYFNNASDMNKYRLMMKGTGVSVSEGFHLLLSQCIYIPTVCDCVMSSSRLRRGQMKEASEMKYGDQVEGVCACKVFICSSLTKPTWGDEVNKLALPPPVGQTWDDIIRVMTSATVRFELLSTVHTSPVSSHSSSFPFSS